jgi:hypothetical protein
LRNCCFYLGVLCSSEAVASSCSGGGGAAGIDESNSTTAAEACLESQQAGTCEEGHGEKKGAVVAAEKGSWFQQAGLGWVWGLLMELQVPVGCQLLTGAGFET